MRNGFVSLGFFLALGFFTCIPVHAEVTTTEVAVSSTMSEVVVVSPSIDVITTPTILQMADGRFYEPASGRTARTREELLLTQNSVVTSTPLTIEPAPAVLPSPTTTLPIFPLRSAIEEGREMLRNAVGTSTVKTNVSLTSDVIVTFAIWDAASSSMNEGSTSSIRLVAHTWQLKEFQKKGIRSIIRGLREEGVVVAVHYPLIREIGAGKKKRYQLTPVVYTPYASALHTPDMVNLGKARLAKLTNEIFTELREKHIPSRAFPDQLVADVLGMDIPQAIVAIEHSDYRSLKKNGEEGIEPFYVLLGANPDNAFGYSVSPMGARGIAQFMPKTYASLVRHRPDVDLETSFDRAMEQPANALKAEILYLDLLLHELPADVRDRYQQQDRKTDEFVVAAYNGGPARVSRAIADWDMVMGSGTRRLVEMRKAVAEESTTMKRLKKKIASETIVQTKSALKKKLAVAEAKKVTLQSDLNHLEKILLRSETIEYILKFRHAVAWLRDDSLIASALTTTESLTSVTSHQASLPTL